jgi:hypothetical protein
MGCTPAPGIRRRKPFRIVFYEANAHYRTPTGNAGERGRNAMRCAMLSSGILLKSAISNTFRFRSEFQARTKQAAWPITSKMRHWLRASLLIVIAAVVSGSKCDCQNAIGYMRGDRFCEDMESGEMGLSGSVSRGLGWRYADRERRISGISTFGFLFGHKIFPSGRELPPIRFHYCS